jgi:hypothetical protein
MHIAINSCVGKFSETAGMSHGLEQVIRPIELAGV